MKYTCYWQQVSTPTDSQLVLEVQLLHGPTSRPMSIISSNNKGTSQRYCLTFSRAYIQYKCGRGLPCSNW